MPDISTYNLILKKLIEKNMLTKEELDEAMLEEKKTGKSVFRILISYGYLEENALKTVLMNWLNMEPVILSKIAIEKSVLDKIGVSTARFYNIMPVKIEGSCITVALADPLNIKIIDELSFILDMDVKIAVANKEDIQKSIKHYYGKKEESLEDIINSKDDKIVSRLLSAVLLKAIDEKTIDMHFEPFEKDFRIRCKRDGAYHDIISMPKDLGSAIIAGIKNMVNLDIDNSILPQEGKILIDIAGEAVTIRVYTLPTLYGESIFIKLLNIGLLNLSIDRIGMPDSIKSSIKNIIKKRSGILLIIGPSNSCKAATLYACLNEINNTEYKIITVEDTVEYEINGITQVALNPERNFTFTKALSNILDQDADIIMVGDIRDSETLELAVEASLTGHLVLAALNANDTIDAITKLRDMGLKPYSISSGIKAVLNQRLVSAKGRNTVTYELLVIDNNTTIDEVLKTVKPST